MSKLLRYYAPGQYCFITTVTHQRQRILDREPIFLLRAVRHIRQKTTFSVHAWVVLPDHIHAIIECPGGDAARIMQGFKFSFSRQWRNYNGCGGPVWQHRYWDHIIRSQDDMNRHLDYIHYNPVKHGLTDAPESWLLSSFHKHHRHGIEPTALGRHEDDEADLKFGE